MKLSVLIALLLVVGNANGAIQPSTKVAQVGGTTLTTYWGKKRIDVILTSAAGKGSECYSGEQRCSVMRKIDLKVSGNELFVPKSVYTNMSDASSASVQTGGAAPVLTIRGGDASESYIIKIIFDDNRVKKKILYSGLSEDHPLEVIDYFDVSLEK